MRLRRVVGVAERVILGALMSMALSVVERLLTSERDVRRAQRLWQRMKGRP